MYFYIQLPADLADLTSNPRRNPAGSLFDHDSNRREIIVPRSRAQRSVLLSATSSSVSAVTATDQGLR